MHTVTALQGEKAGTLGKSISKQLGQAELALVPGFTCKKRGKLGTLFTCMTQKVDTCRLDACRGGVHRLSWTPTHVQAYVLPFWIDMALMCYLSNNTSLQLDSSPDSCPLVESLYRIEEYTIIISQNLLPFCL